MEYNFKGTHVFGEMYEVPADLLNDLALIEKALLAGIVASGASLCSIQHKEFEGGGLTSLALLSESHASIHTYPEKGALFFDAFTCGDHCFPHKIIDTLAEFLKPGQIEIKTVERGK